MTLDARMLRLQAEISRQLIAQNLRETLEDGGLPGAFRFRPDGTMIVILGAVRGAAAVTLDLAKVIEAVSGDASPSAP